MFSALRDRLAAKATAIGVTLVLLGGGVALAVPDEAVSGQETAAANQAAAEKKALEGQETAAANRTAAEEKALTGQETAAANRTAAEEKAAEAQENADIAEGEGVPEVVEIFLGELEAWVGCIQEGAAAHADQQSNEETRVEDDEYDAEDKLALCGDKPVNPNDVNEEDGVEAEGGPEDDGDLERPDDAGKPDDAGRPDDAGKPEDAGRPDDAGPDS